MNQEGHIKLFRKMFDWEWYSDVNATRLFIHCLLKANWKDGRFRGKTIPRGSFVTSYENLANETSLSIRQVRTALSKLKTTNELTSKSTNEYTLINVVKYNDYQDSNFENDKRNVNRMANERQTNDKRMTTIEEYKEIKNIKNNNISDKSPMIYFPLNEKLESTFQEYLSLRKKMKMQNTERAVQLLVNKLEPYADDTKIKMLENAIINNWKSVYPLKENKSSSFLDLLEDENAKK